MSFLMLCSVSIVVFSAIKKPYEKNSENKYSLISEIVFLVSLVPFYFLFEASLIEEENREVISWIIIAFFSTIILL
jgi:hypothetical protein